METKSSGNGILLRIKGLKTYFFTEVGTVKAVDGVDLAVKAGSTLGILGESGCGKSVTALSIMRLITGPLGRIVAGKIIYKGIDLLKLSKGEIRKIRGNQISMIFQEPMTALNPIYRVGDQIAEVISLHQKAPKKEAMERAIETLKLVKIPSPEIRIKDYPHQLSGGMRQRIMIAMALSCNPSLMIADEPTTALDVTIQAQVLDLMMQLKEEINTSIMLITHDLGVIAENAQEVAVMYAGKIVEYTSKKKLFENPLHPYTVGLMKSTPSLGGKRRKESRLPVIPGIVPNLYDLPEGCSFAERCPDAGALCRESRPELLTVEEGHLIRCFKDRFQ